MGLSLQAANENVTLKNSFTKHFFSNLNPNALRRLMFDNDGTGYKQSVALFSKVQEQQTQKALDEKAVKDKTVADAKLKHKIFVQVSGDIDNSIRLFLMFGNAIRWATNIEK